MKVGPFRKEKGVVISDLEIHEQRLLSFSVVSGLWMSRLFPFTLARALSETISDWFPF